MRRHDTVIALIACLVSIPAMAQDKPDPGRGATLYAARCALCHAPDRVKVGPPLGGVYGRKAGSVAGYPYTGALRGSGLTWDAATLDRWLAGPPALVPGTRMQISVPDTASRADIIAYLKHPVQ